MESDKVQKSRNYQFTYSTSDYRNTLEFIRKAKEGKDEKPDLGKTQN